jgi:hypothetical protein
MLCYALLLLLLLLLLSGAGGRLRGGAEIRAAGKQKRVFCAILY